MAITMVEIAKRTNLSPATVSRVLNGKGVGFISDATRQRVLDAARELGYAANRPARPHSNGRTHVLGALIRHPHRPYYARILRHLLETSSAAGYDLVITPVDDQIAHNGGFHNGAAKREGVPGAASIDGIFAADCPAIAEGYAQRFGAGACPVVGLSSDCSEKSDYVALDVACGVRQAVEHLVSIGCRRIAHLTTMSAIGRVRAARSGTYEEVVQSAGLAPEIILSPDENRAAARETIKSYYQSRGTPDGLFCFSDDMAIGAYRGLRDLGLRVPDDVALVGCDGMDDVQYLDVPLTTIVQPVQEMCRLAREVLMRRIEDPTASLSQTLLKPELRIDASTRR